MWNLPFVSVHTSASCVLRLSSAHSACSGAQPQKSSVRHLRSLASGSPHMMKRASRLRRRPLGHITKEMARIQMLTL